MPPSAAVSLAREWSFSGVMAVGLRSRPVFEVPLGLSDREAGAPMTTGTWFQVGSISKWLTAVVALRLVERGLLELHAPIGRYLTTCPRDVGDAVRVVDLLSNTSGVRDQLPTELINEPEVAASPMTAAQAVPVYVAGPLEFEPGTRFDYSHTNWLLVQAVVEEAGGETLEQLLAELVTAPLGLTSTGVTAGAFESVPAHAVAYATGDPRAPRTLHVVPRFLGSTGTMYSAAGDLVRLAHAVYGGVLLTPPSIDSLNEVRWSPEDYAIGGRVKHRERNGTTRTVAFEIGSFGGFTTLLQHVVEDEVTVVVLNSSNLDQEAVTRLADELLEEAYGDRLTS